MIASRIGGLIMADQTTRPTVVKFWDRFASPANVACGHFSSTQEKVQSIMAKMTLLFGDDFLHEISVVANLNQPW